MAETLVEKLISRRAGRTVHAGEIVSVAVDRLLFNDYVGALVFEQLDSMGVREIVRPERVFIAIDHNIPAFSVDAADKYVLLHEKAREYGITRISNMGDHGIGHQMMCERYVKPLEITAGTDSHATMYAGTGAFSCGVTTSDAIQILTTGKMWMRVPETIRIRVKGKLSRGVTAKDLSLKIISLLPEKIYAYKAVEITGEAVGALSVSSRLVLANMMAETGAKCAVLEADEKSYAFTGENAGERLVSDRDAVFYDTLEVDASALEPQLACPDAVRNVQPLSGHTGIHVDQVFIGSCTNGRMEDLLQAAEILRGRHTAEGTRLVVTPASQRIYLEAMKTGVLEVLVNAGATVLPSSCASCAGHGPGLIGRGEVCVSTTNRNFKGRMGSLSGQIYLGSAYAAAAAAVTGEITDPLSLLSE